MPSKNKKIDLANIKIGYEGFRDLARNKDLSPYEKIGFPDSYREGLEDIIFQDILGKLTNLNQTGKNILDIGAGCSDLPKFIIELCEKQKHKLVFCDSEEMLSFHKDSNCLTKIEGMFPNTYNQVIQASPKYDAILCYSVFQYVFIDTNVWSFIDKCLSLLAPGGQLLIGDIPNISKRKRFFSSETGINFHKQFMKTEQNPEVLFNLIEEDKIDDAVVLGILMRAQAAGFDAYLMPQGKNLPMSNRRDDILITRP